MSISLPLQIYIYEFEKFEGHEYYGKELKMHKFYICTLAPGEKLIKKFNKKFGISLEEKSNGVWEYESYFYENYNRYILRQINAEVI